MLPAACSRLYSVLSAWAGVFARSTLSDKIKRDFFQAVAVSVLLYGCTNLTLKKHMEKKLDENYARMLHAVWRNPGSNTTQKGSCISHFTNSETHQSSPTRHAGHCWRNKGELISDVLKTTPTCGHNSVSRPVETYNSSVRVLSTGPVKKNGW